MQDSIAYTIVKQLWDKNRNFCSSDYDFSIEFLSSILPFRTLEFHNDYNGWEIPPKWDFAHASIRKGTQTIFEATNPLQVIGLSLSYSGRVDCDELKAHLYYDHRDTKATPYHFRQNYRPWKRDWGLCVTKELYDSITPGEYEVNIVTHESKGYLKVIDYHLKGKLKETIAFVAHLDHPYMANDDLAGVAVGVELFKKISQHPRKFSYRLVLVQEVIGSVYYLNHEKTGLDSILESCFLEMLGTKTPLALQASYHGDSQVETILEDLLKTKKLKYRKGPFRSIISNDEGVWESYGIPMASISRYPYPEYHSDKDNLSIIDPNALAEAVDLLYETIEKIERQTLLRKKFEGVIALANPQYDLYIDPGQPAFGFSAGEDARLRSLMDLLPLLPKICFVEKVARQTGLPLEPVLEYIRRWQERGLVELA